MINCKGPVFLGSFRPVLNPSIEFDQAWYSEVISACGLVPDFQQLEHGDATSVGQEGIALSGGQRARIGLARAIYRRARVVLLDDPLSAVDRHVSKLIWDKCIQGLLKHVTVLITTHQLNYIHEADYIYHLGLAMRNNIYFIHNYFFLIL